MTLYCIITLHCKCSSFYAFSLHIRIRKLTNESYAFISKERVWEKLLFLFYVFLHSLTILKSTTYVIIIVFKNSIFIIIFIFYTRLSSVKARICRLFTMISSTTIIVHGTHEVFDKYLSNK